MKTPLLTTAFTLCAHAALALGQSPDFVFDRVNINQVDSAVFEAIPRGAASTDRIWCAASEYAVRRLGADWRQKLYVERGYARSVTTGRPTSVQFTLDPKATGLQTKEPGFGFQPGANVTVQLANTRCGQFPFGMN
ncbi:hypothetical protein M3P21_14540 [Ruegeria sp. 2012CJ41-6]|uniref:Uncharacterized protein n=1 Tax=Ruegeria spongiae TaxID=2942209 RepID=A0ABT0Q4P3_9RHOB|nr:hypothetical protein [Ruegeria spongiae]MCL6284752.1 hypothetical protein [Ruegeria spongiae]